MDDEIQGAPNAQDTANATIDRQAAALEAFNKPDEAAKPDAPAGDQPKPDAAATTEQPKPDAPKPDAQAGEIEKAPFFNDATFQKFYKETQEARTVVGEFRKIFDAGRYAIKDADTLKAVHEDAFLLYDIAAGQKSPGELLEVFKKNWSPEQFKGVLQELANYAAREGVEGKKEAPNPFEERLSKIEQGEKDRQARADAEATEKRQMAVVESLEKEIRRLCTDKGLVAGEKATEAEKKEIESEIVDYLNYVSAELGKNKDLVAQLEKGQFGEAQRIFTERFNILTARAKRYADGQIKKFDERGKILPNQPRTGSGAPPAAKPAAAGKGTTAERALEAWNKG